MLRGYLKDTALLSRVGLRFGAGSLAFALLIGSQAHAFDGQQDAGSDNGGVASFAPGAAPRNVPTPEPEVDGEKRSWLTFKFGFSAYKKGHKGEAFKAYSDAAKEGHIGARWKLANMYAAGDGIKENDYEAFKLFRGIASQGAPQGSQESAYVADALVSIANYVQTGIKGSPVKPDPARARDIYWQAAANFGDANAQFRLGQMLLNGEGGAVDRRQAGRWFNLSAKKGHSGSRAMLGQMMFEAGKTVEGIGMMTAALKTASSTNRGWIRSMQEEAFALSSEAERRTGIAYGQTLLAK